MHNRDHTKEEFQHYMYKDAHVPLLGLNHAPTEERHAQRAMQWGKVRENVESHKVVMLGVVCRALCERVSPVSVPFHRVR